MANGHHEHSNDGRLWRVDRPEDDRPRGDDGGWRKALISGLWVLLVMVIGWIATDAYDTQKQMAAELRIQSQRITVQEGETRHTRDILQRIESSSNENRQLLEQLLRERRTR